MFLYLGSMDNISCRSVFLSSQLRFLPHHFRTLFKCFCLVIFAAHHSSSMFWEVDTKLNGPNRFLDKYLVNRYGVPTNFWFRFVFNYYFGQRPVLIVLKKVNLLSETSTQCAEFFIGVIVLHDCPIYQSPRRAVCARPGDPSPQLLRPLLREYMKKNQFPPDLQRSVLDQEIHNFTRRQGMDVDAIFSELPRSLLRDVLLHMYGDLLAKVPMLDGTEDGFRLELMERLTTVTIFAEFCEIESCSGHGLGETGSQAFVRPGPCPPCRAIHHQVAVNLVEKGNERKGTVPRHVHCRRERRERVWQSFASAPQPASQGDRQVARRGFGGTAARSRDASAANHQVVCVCKDSSELHCACHNVGQSQGRGRAWSRPIRIYQHDPPTQPP
ncbi:hypothetical protein BC828DRAFT_283654 [Blastocladiella britannica]|nr:hypothetical protein BC828DRAFT_283654 [Blastocladiella britannica]